MATVVPSSPSRRPATATDAPLLQKGLSRRRSPVNPLCVTLADASGRSRGSHRLTGRPPEARLDQRACGSRASTRRRSGWSAEPLSRTEKRSTYMQQACEFDRRRHRREPGEILVRCPMLLRAYRDGTTRGAPAPTARVAGSQQGRRKAPGRRHVGRRRRLAEVIVTGGEKVWPAGSRPRWPTTRRWPKVAVWRRARPRMGPARGRLGVPAPEGAPTLDELVDLVRASPPALGGAEGTRARHVPAADGAGEGRPTRTFVRNGQLWAFASS